DQSVGTRTMGQILDYVIVETVAFAAAREIDEEIRLQPVHGGIAGPLVPPCLRAETARDEPGEVKLLWHGLSFRGARRRADTGEQQTPCQSIRRSDFRQGALDLLFACLTRAWTNRAPA